MGETWKSREQINYNISRKNWREESLIPELDTSSSWAVSIAFQWIYSTGKGPGIHWATKVVWAFFFLKQKNLLLLWGIEPRFLGRPARRQSLNRLSQRFPKCASRIALYPRPVPRGSVDTLLQWLLWSSPILDPWIHCSNGYFEVLLFWIRGYTAAMATVKFTYFGSVDTLLQWLLWSSPILKTKWIIFFQ
jgi:hypothetical protein